MTTNVFLSTITALTLSLNACGQEPAQHLHAGAKSLPSINPIAFTPAGPYSTGLYEEDVVQRYVERGDAAVVAISDSKTIVQNLRYEIHENSKVSSNQLATSFGFIEASYVSTISNRGTNMELDSLEYSYIILDGLGKAADIYLTVSFEQRAEDGKLVWYKSVKEGGDLLAFHAKLPDFAKAKLYQTTGFLQQNAGKPVISYNITDADVARTVLNLALDLAPGLVKKAGGELVDYIVKEAAHKGVEAALKNDGLRFGADFSITDPTAVEFADQYTAAGQAAWVK